MSTKESTEPEKAALDDALERATEAVAFQASRLGELTGTGSEPVGLGKLLDVPVKVTVQVGRTQMTLGELMKLGPGSLVQLDREAHEPADILVNGKVVAQGEIVTIDDVYGVRITHVKS